MILSKDTFDPDAVFMDDIVDDEVLPYLSLAVDGLTTPTEARKEDLELRPEDEVAANDDPIDTPVELPEVPSGAEQLEVYGWERSLWRKLKSYVGF